MIFGLNLQGYQTHHSQWWDDSHGGTSDYELLALKGFGV